MKTINYSQLLRGMFFAFMSLGVNYSSAAFSDDNSIYADDNRKVLAAYINQDVYIVDDQHYEGNNYNGAVTSEIPVEIRGYTSRKPGKYSDEGDLLALQSYSMYNVGSALTGNGNYATEPSWFASITNLNDYSYADLNSGSRPYKAGLAYRLFIPQNNIWLNGSDHDNQHLYSPDDTGNYTKLADNTWQIRVPGHIQFFKYGDLLTYSGTTHTPAPLPVDISPQTAMLMMGVVGVQYFPVENTMVNGGPEEKKISSWIYVIGNIHFASSHKPVQITGNVFAGEISLSDNTAVGKPLGPSLTTNLSFPVGSNDPITSLRLSNEQESRKINGVRVFDTGVQGIGYQVTDKNGKELSPISATVQGGELTIPLNLTFIKTGDVLPRAEVSKLANLGKVMVITGNKIKERVLYDPDKSLSYASKTTVQPLGCDE
jgi:hypothetical protein